MSQALPKNVKLIGRYAILRELRRDRYTVAYLALDPVLNREVVLKAVQLQPPAGQDASGHERIEQAFMRQAQAAGRLHHPHIVTVFDAGRFRTVGYLALERVDGKLLEDLLAENFKPGFLHAADITARVADAVEYAHSRGVPHGHLAPSRIYLHGSDRSPKVMGFGGWIDSGATGDFELAGTQSMLPYFRSELDAQSRRKDVRALGALLFLLLTGKRFDAAVTRAHKGRDHLVLELRPSAPLALAEIAEGALELGGSQPFRTAAQVRNALTTYLWGNRGEQGLPNAATITGMPARLEVVRGGAIAVPTVAMLRPPPRPLKQRAAWRPHIVATAFAGAAMIAVAWFANHGAPTAEPGMKRDVATTPAAVAPGNVELAVASGPSTEAVALIATSETPRRPVPAEKARSSAQTTRFGGQSQAQAPKSAALAPVPMQGVVAFAVVPWGEVFINGLPHGTSPPVTHLMLPVGRHTIELRNGSRASFVAQVDVSPERPQHISHRFQ
jgi:eukaryotic-like serine/threonine-protein kinase